MAGQINPKDAAVFVAVIAGLYLGYKVVNGVASAGSAAGHAIGTAVDGVASAAHSVGDAIGGAWNWATGLFEPAPTQTVLTSDQVKRVEQAAANPYDLGYGTWQATPQAPISTGTDTGGSVLGGSILTGPTFDNPAARGTY